MILCSGEALIDMIPTTTGTGDKAYVPHVGGSVFNTAIALGRLGARVGMMTGISNDMFGQQLFEALKANHVETQFVVRSDRLTTLAFVHLVDGDATYDFYDENSAGRMLSTDELPDVPDEVSALYFGGISLSCEPSADTYASFLADKKAGRAVMIDPNIRPRFVQNPARFRERMDGMLAEADIVKVSDADLNWLIEEPVSLQDKVARLQQRGPSLVILTRGADGTTGYHANGETVAVPARKVTVVDTVGAGDTFNAGVLAKLSELGLLTPSALRELTSESMKDALDHGTRVAAITVSRAGAQPPWASELQAR